jgi:glycerophosphoryl diester phosphodiesterase
VPGLIRVGHKGAHHIAPGNTIESFEAALAHGVDMIEFDVLRMRDGRLVLAHDYADADGRDPLSLEVGLDHFAGEAYAGIELDVDLKLPGYEREVAEGLLERELGGRSLVSSASSLRGCGAAGRCRGCSATTSVRRWPCRPTRSRA